MSTGNPLPNVQQIVERELSQLDYSHGRSKEQLLAHFYMAPSLKAALEQHLPDKTFTSAQAVLEAIPNSTWSQLQNAIEHGSPESHYLQSQAAKFSTWGETSGFGHVGESAQANPPGSGQPGH